MSLGVRIAKWYVRHRVRKAVKRLKKEVRVNISDKLKSRKLWITVLATLLSVFYPAAIPILKVIVPTYLGAQGLADAAAALKG